MFLPPATQRPLFLLGFATSAALMAAALFMQYRLDLEPCPLCILQRIVVMTLGAIALVAAWHNPRGFGRRVYGGAFALLGITGGALSARHLWLQHLPADQVPACGPSLNYILETFPLGKALGLILRGSGECAAVQWTFLGLSIPGWTLIAFTGFLALGLLLLLARPPLANLR